MSKKDFDNSVLKQRGRIFKPIETPVGIDQNGPKTFLRTGEMRLNFVKEDPRQKSITIQKVRSYQIKNTRQLDTETERLLREQVYADGFPKHPAIAAQSITPGIKHHEAELEKLMSDGRRKNRALEQARTIGGEYFEKVRPELERGLNEIGEKIVLYKKTNLPNKYSYELTEKTNKILEKLLATSFVPSPPPKAETPPPKAETPPPKAETPPPKAETPPPKASRRASAPDAPPPPPPPPEPRRASAPLGGLGDVLKGLGEGKSNLKKVGKTQTKRRSGNPMMDELHTTVVGRRKAIEPDEEEDDGGFPVSPTKSVKDTETTTSSMMRLMEIYEELPKQQVKFEPRSATYKLNITRFSDRVLDKDFITELLKDEKFDLVEQKDKFLNAFETPPPSSKSENSKIWGRVYGLFNFVEGGMIEFTKSGALTKESKKIIDLLKDGTETNVNELYKKLGQKKGQAAGLDM